MSAWGYFLFLFFFARALQNVFTDNIFWTIQFLFFFSAWNFKLFNACFMRISLLGFFLLSIFFHVYFFCKCNFIKWHVQLLFVFPSEFLAGFSSHNLSCWFGLVKVYKVNGVPGAANGSYYPSKSQSRNLETTNYINFTQPQLNATVQQTCTIISHNVLLTPGPSIFNSPPKLSLNTWHINPLIPSSAHHCNISTPSTPSPAIY